jgi:hypothetical protein
VSRVEWNLDGVAPIAPPLIDGSNLTENERAWVDFLRLISNETDPEPTLKRVQLLRRVLLRRKRRGATNWR